MVAKRSLIVAENVLIQGKHNLFMNKKFKISLVECFRVVGFMYQVKGRHRLK